MILLDTNYLIQALVDGSAETRLVRRWLEAEETLCTSAVAWYEFLGGPVDDDGVELVRSILGDRVLPYTADHAAESARLWNLTGRQRFTRLNAMIAAAAVVTGSALATGNADGFRPYTAHGLRLARS